MKNGDLLEKHILLIKRFDIKTTKAGGVYADILFSDKTGEITAKYWDIPEKVREAFKVGDIAELSGNVANYRENPQIIVKTMDTAPADADSLADLVESAPYSSERMYNKIIEVINSVKNDDIRNITLTILEENKEKLLYYPAAKSFHHAIRSGLLYHTYTMMRTASALSEVYDFLNKDLLFAGVALHDIGKIKEITGEQTGVAREYSAEGKLLGHITISVCMIDETGKKLNCDPEIIMLLKHMVLSHHFYPEYGSPISPMFAEAEILHHIDVLDARMDQFRKTTEATPQKDFSEKVWILDKRSVYNHALGEEENK